MYTIIYGGGVIYDDTMPHDKEYQITDFKLSIADSKAGSLTMTVPPTNGRYSFIRQSTDMRVPVEVYTNGILIWKGRSTSVSVDLFNNFQIFCEGAIAWLDDALYEGYPQMQSSSSAYKLETGRSKVLSILSGYTATMGSSQRVKPEYQIGEGFVNMDIDGEADSAYRIPACAPDTTKTCLQRLQDVQKTYGGHFGITYHDDEPYIRLNWYKNIWGRNAEGSYTQTAFFGENLLSYARTISTDDVVTVIRPYGEMLDNAPKTEVAKTNIYSDTSPFINQRRIALDGEVVTVENTNYYVARLTIEQGKKYYYTAHMRGNFSLFAVKDSHGDPLFVKTNYGGNAPDNTKAFEFKDVEIPLPVGAVYIDVGFYKDATYEADKGVTLIDYSNVAYTPLVNEQNKDAYRTTIADVNDGNEWLVANWTLFNKYGWIERRVNFAGINQPQALYEATQEYIENMSFNAISIEVSFLDLAAMGVAPVPLRLFDGVRVRTAEGEEYIMYVTKIDLSKNPAQSKITLGTSLSKGISSMI